LGHACFEFNLPAFENKNKYAACDRFHGNGPYGEIPTKKEPIRALGFALPYNNEVYYRNIILEKRHKNYLTLKQGSKLRPIWSPMRLKTFNFATKNLSVVATLATVFPL